MADRIGYVEPGSPNKWLRTTQATAADGVLDHVQHVVVASQPAQLATFALNVVPTLAAVVQPTIAVVPPATQPVSVGTVLAVVQPTIAAVVQPTLAVVPPATVAVGTLALPTLSVVPPATVAVGTLAFPATLAIGTLALATQNVVPPATVAVGTLALPTLSVVPPATQAVGTVALPQLDRRFGPQATTAARQIVGSGIATVVAPASGKRIRLEWLGMSTSASNAVEALAVCKFGGSGAEFYRWNMGAPGAFAHWQAIDGPADTAFIIALSGASAPVELSYTYEEIT